ncbi:MAG TPA: EpsI family protein [Terriglobales bacterium]|nr:EpsI family protein [Terriglobales bacterium]
MKSFRFAIVVSLLTGTALLLNVFSHGEIYPSRLSLAYFPERLGKWVGTTLPMTKEVLDILGPGDYLLRDYQDSTSLEPPVGLFIAYFPSQRAGDTIHSPKHCLPGAGWWPVESSKITVSLPGHVPFPANRYVIAKGDERQLVIYWYLAHDRAIASEYWAKFYLVTDSIRLHRSDGSLVRIITPLRPAEPIDEAQDRLLSFADNITPVINQYVPR